jgi:hypothetical protein
MRLIDADKLKQDCLTNDGHLAITQSQISEAETFEGIKWIPIKYHKVSEQERAEKGLSPDADICFDCELPEDGQEILITVKYTSPRSGEVSYYVEKDTFCNDEQYGCYLESCYEFPDEVTAWAQLPNPCKKEWIPLPEAYKAESEG